MDFAGEYRIETSRETVWKALNDPEVLQQCIPGCQDIEKESDTALSAKVKSKIGPISVTFNGKVTLSDLDPPKAYTISGEGQGGVAGFARGGARVTLDEDGIATVLRYAANGQVGGKLAQVGARLVEGAAKKIADDFFTRFNAIVAELSVAETPAVAPPAPSVATKPAAPTPQPKGRLDSSAPRSSLFENLWFGVTGLTLLVLFVMAGIQQ